MKTKLEEFMVELGKQFGKITRWKALCKEYNAITDAEKVKIAEQVLTEWTTGTVAEFSSHQAKLDGIKPISVDDFLTVPKSDEI